MKFSDIQLHPKTQEGIQSQNFEECTPIQAESIPHVLINKDVAGLAQTGTGKTAAYVVPLIDRILWSKEETVPEEFQNRVFANWLPSHYILVLVPTRELAEQVSETVKKLGESAGMKCAAIFGGTSYEPQKAAINRGVQFVVATPGRLIDLYKEKVIDFNNVRAVVFDEADRMFDMGFKQDSSYILKRISPERQLLVFSATLNFDVLNFAYESGSEPIEVNVSKDQTKAENVTDEIFHVGHGEKPKFLLSVLKKHDPKQVIIFSNFKRNVERIAQFLSSNGYPAMGISSLLTQPQRQRVIQQFKEENDRNILVATDVAARGLDIKGVDMVINYELPDDAENYVHRIGRTGRASQTGQAYSMVSDMDIEALGRIEDYMEGKVAIGWLDDGDFVEDFKPFPREVRDNHRGNDRGRGRNSRDGNRPRRDSDRKASGRNDRSGSDRNRTERNSSDRKRNDNEHRDRRTGRHKEVPAKGREADKRNERSTRPNRGASTKSAGQRGRRPSAKAAPQSLGQKVAGFFKKLFGSEEVPEKKTSNDRQRSSGGAKNNRSRNHKAKGAGQNRTDNPKRNAKSKEESGSDKPRGSSKRRNRRPRRPRPEGEGGRKSNSEASASASKTDS